MELKIKTPEPLEVKTSQLMVGELTENDTTQPVLVLPSLYVDPANFEDHDEVHLTIIIRKG